MKKSERFHLPVAVFLLLLNEHGETLFIRRATTGWKDGYYSLPAGGLEKNEDLYEAVIRETEEEIGVSVRREDIKHLYTQQCFVGEQNWINVYFQTQVWQGEPKVCEPEKHSEVCWRAKNVFPEPMVEYVHVALSESSSGIYGGVFVENSW